MPGLGLRGKILPWIKKAAGQMIICLSFGAYAAKQVSWDKIFVPNLYIIK